MTFGINFQVYVQMYSPQADAGTTNRRGNGHDSLVVKDMQHAKAYVPEAFSRSRRSWAGKRGLRMTLSIDLTPLRTYSRSFSFAIQRPKIAVAMMTSKRSQVSFDFALRNVDSHSRAIIARWHRNSPLHSCQFRLLGYRIDLFSV